MANLQGICGLTLFLPLALCMLSADVEAETVQFNRDVRPILSKHCFPCHGPDEASREADLRLDVDGSLSRHSGGQPSLAEKLLLRIQSDDDDQRMPPPPHEPLGRTARRTLERWIAEGARYEVHWSFVPPDEVARPKPDATSWAKTPIDQFILARLEKENLEPSPPADRQTLIRRVTLDLTGLPPTPQEQHKFLEDHRPDAYVRLVDRLMKTKAYAERRAQDWLDLARYADTRGFADDQTRQIWPWRDWVVQALDKNMPFDQFTIEQLAGDLLPNATDEQRLATAFHRNAPQAKGVTYPTEEYRLKGVVDRVNTTGRVWLGLTMGCAECHDHKFDPISQRDYYSLFAIFNNIEHTGIGYAQGGPSMKYHLESKQDVARFESDRANVAEKISRLCQQDAVPKRISDDRQLGSWDTATVVADANTHCITSDFTLVARVKTVQPVADIASKYDWKGKQRSYVFGIGGEGEATATPGHLFCWVSAKTEPFEGVEVYGSFRINDGLEHDVAVEFEAGKSVRLFVDGVEDAQTRIVGKIPSSIARSDRSLAIGSGYNDKLEADAFKFEGELANVRLYEGAVCGDLFSATSSRDEIAKLQSELRELDALIAGDNETTPTVPVMRELAEPRSTYVHVRGNFLNRGELVEPAVPAMFSAAAGFDQPKDRLEFARWLVNGQNPLVARVVVNRFWQSYFGRGLVTTSDDLGAQGSLPSHPKLLDWLANEFVNSGWDMKHMHRLIVTSATYQQSTKSSPDLRDRDPDNALLARMSRPRLSAEQIRDQALVVSGLLSNQVGGPPVFPPQPDGYWQQRALPGEWKNSDGVGRFRRTMYTYWRRMALHPSLELLNAPARETCVVMREVSNVPTQALVLLNDPMFHEAAQAMAIRLLRAENGNEQRLDLAFRLTLGRKASREERTKFLQFLDRSHTAQDPTKEKPVTKPSASDSVEQVAWTSICSVLLNLDETITRP